MQQGGKSKRWKTLKSAVTGVPSGPFTAASASRGSFHRFTFKTDDQGTGYYKEERPPPITDPVQGLTRCDITNAAKETGAASTTDHAGPTARARRGRCKNGTRKKKNSRLARLAAVFIPMLAATGQLADRDWKDAGL